MKSILFTAVFAILTFSAAQAQKFGEYTATVIGKFSHTPDNISTITAYYEDFVTGVTIKANTTLAQDGSFELVVPIILEKQVVNFDFSGKGEAYALLSASDTVYMDINTDRIHNHYSSQPWWAFEFVSFSGANSIENQTIASEEFSKMINDICYFPYNKSQKIKDNPKTVAFYNKRKSEVKNLLSEYYKKIEEKGYPTETQNFLKAELNCYALRYFGRNLNVIHMVYNKAGNTTHPTNKKLRNQLDMNNWRLDNDLTTYSILKDYSFDDPLILSTHIFGQTFEEIKNEILQYNDNKSQLLKEFELYSDLKPMIEPNDQSTLSTIISNILNEKPLNDKAIAAFNTKYNDQLEYLKKKQQTNLTAKEILGDNKLHELIETQNICKNLRMKKSLTNEELDQLKQYSDVFYYRHAKRLSDEFNQTPSTIKFMTVSDKTGDELYHEIFDRYKGKVVLADFWFVSCSCCLACQKLMRSVDQELKSKGVEFVYITDSKISPLEQYKKTITNMNGDSYYLTSEQLQSIISPKAWPTYWIINKEGKIIDKTIGCDIEKFETILTQEASK